MVLCDGGQFKSSQVKKAWGARKVDTWIRLYNIIQYQYTTIRNKRRRGTRHPSFVTPHHAATQLSADHSK